MPKESIITRIKVPIDVYNKDPRMAIQQRIGTSTSIFGYKKLTLITNDSCYLVDVTHSPHVVNKLAIIDIKDIKHDEKNNRYLYMYKNQLVQLSMSQVVLSKFTSKIPVKIFRTYNNVDDIKLASTIYKQPFTSIMTPLKNNVKNENTPKNTPKNPPKNTPKNNTELAELVDHMKQVRVYEQRIKNLPLSVKISKLEYTGEIPEKTAPNTAYLVDYLNLPDNQIAGTLYTVSDRRYDPNMILYYNDPTEIITKANIRSIKEIMSSDIERYNLIKECYIDGKIEISE